MASKNVATVFIASSHSGARWKRNWMCEAAFGHRSLGRSAGAAQPAMRVRLAGLLIESLEPPPDPDVQQLWAEEAERRWREIGSGGVATVPWEEVRTKLFRG